MYSFFVLRRLLAQLRLHGRLVGAQRLCVPRRPPPLQVGCGAQRHSAVANGRLQAALCYLLLFILLPKNTPRARSARPAAALAKVVPPHTHAIACAERGGLQPACVRWVHRSGGVPGLVECFNCVM